MSSRKAARLKRAERAEKLLFTITLVCRCGRTRLLGVNNYRNFLYNVTVGDMHDDTRICQSVYI